MAKFWRWAVQQDTSDPHIEDFIADMVDLLYSEADLKQLHEAVPGESVGLHQTLGERAQEGNDARVNPRAFLPDGVAGVQ